MQYQPNRKLGQEIVLHTAFVHRSHQIQQLQLILRFMKELQLHEIKS